jgi:hypothetical protein
MTYTLILLFCMAASGECREVVRPGHWSLKACAEAGQQSGAHAWKCRVRSEESV